LIKALVRFWKAWRFRLEARVKMAGAAPIAVLTRPAGRNTDVMHALVRRGWIVHECPALEIHTAAIASAHNIPDPKHYDLVVFVSRAAVTGFTKQLEPNFVWPSGVRVGCMGPATALAIERAWPTVSNILHPDAEKARDSEALWPLLQALTSPLNKVLIVRGQDGRDWLSDKLGSQGVEVLTHQAYERVQADWSADTVELFRAWAGASTQVSWLLTSGHGITSVALQLQCLGLLDWFRSGQFVLTHERLAQTLAKAVGGNPGELQIHLCQPEDPKIVLCFDQILGG
jgi:uroporphyrinogen-III synthase